MNGKKYDKSVKNGFESESDLLTLQMALHELIRRLQVQLDELIIILRSNAGRDEVKWAVVAQAERLRRVLNALPDVLDQKRSDGMALLANVTRAEKAIAALRRTAARRSQEPLTSQPNSTS